MQGCNENHAHNVENVFGHFEFELQVKPIYVAQQDYKQI